jgi:hypothetical protein
MLGMFLIALTTSLTAWFCYLNTSDEIPRIMAIAIGSLSMGYDLVIAPWPLQLCLVFLILYRTRHLTPPSTTAS